MKTRRRQEMDQLERIQEGQMTSTNPNRLSAGGDEPKKNQIKIQRIWPVVTVRHFESVVEEDMIASRVPGTDHQPVFHDLLCVQRQPHARSFLLNNKNKC